jgi:hypothetical protein
VLLDSAALVRDFDYVLSHFPLWLFCRAHSVCCPPF